MLFKLQKNVKNFANITIFYFVLEKTKQNLKKSFLFFAKFCP